jgi:hypothetical protein
VVSEDDVIGEVMQETLDGLVIVLLLVHSCEFKSNV